MVRGMTSPSWVGTRRRFSTSLGGSTPALLRSARTVFLALVRLAITWLRHLISSRWVRTSSEGTWTVGVSPGYKSFTSRSASLRSFLVLDRKICCS